VASSVFFFAVSCPYTGTKGRLHDRHSKVKIHLNPKYSADATGSYTPDIIQSSFSHTVKHLP